MGIKAVQTFVFFQLLTPASKLYDEPTFTVSVTLNLKMQNLIAFETLVELAKTQKLPETSGINIVLAKYMLLLLENWVGQPTPVAEL